MKANDAHSPCKASAILQLHFIGCAVDHCQGGALSKLCEIDVEGLQLMRSGRYSMRARRCTQDDRPHMGQKRTTSFLSSWRTKVTDTGDFQSTCKLFAVLHHIRGQTLDVGRVVAQRHKPQKRHRHTALRPQRLRLQHQEFGVSA